MTTKPQAPAADRNKQPILQVLKSEFRDCKSIIEIGSGTGQHAVFIAGAMPWLSWQTSDLIQNHDGIRSWLGEYDLSNVHEPIELDVQSPGDLGGEYDGVFSANTAHIMTIQAVQCMFDIVGQLLPDRGVFCLYGPFNQDGAFSSDSNRRFDESLRSQDSSMGIRDLEELDKFAHENSMLRERLFAMPANNFLAVWIKSGVRRDQ